MVFCAVKFDCRVLPFTLQTAWVLFKRNAEYKPLQFLAFGFVYRLFEKLKSFESPVSPTYNVRFIFHDIIQYILTLFGLEPNSYQSKLASGTGGWRGYRRRAANGKTTTPITGFGFWLHSCFIIGMTFKYTLWVTWS